MHDDVPAPGATIVELDAARRGRRPSRPREAPRQQPGPLYAVAALVVALGAVASVLTTLPAIWVSRGADEAAVRVLARALPLMVAALVHLRLFAPKTLLLLTLVLGTAHLGDFFVAIASGDPWRLAVPLVCGLATLACAIPQLAEAFFGAPRP